MQEINKISNFSFWETQTYFKNIDLIIIGSGIVGLNAAISFKEKYKKRFDRLLNILNSPNNILCFLRIENYYNYDWHNELLNLTKALSLFNNPRKYLIYSQELIDDKLHFDNCRELNYDYNIPIMFIKHYFYDKEMINNKTLFITILSTFEYLMEIMRKAPDFC